MDLILYAENRSSEIGSGNLKINFRCQKIKSIYKWKGEKKKDSALYYIPARGSRQVAKNDNKKTWNSWEMKENNVWEWEMVWEYFK